MVANTHRLKGKIAGKITFKKNKNKDPIDKINNIVETISDKIIITSLSKKFLI